MKTAELKVIKFDNLDVVTTSRNVPSDSTGAEKVEPGDGDDI